MGGRCRLEEEGLKKPSPNGFVKVSVALCTYNGAKYLNDQLRSIASQTRRPDELVVCDDGSADGTLEILRDFQKKSPFKVDIYENESNLGSIRNFDKAIGLCEGDIIFLADQDDVWTSGKIEKSLTAFEEHPGAGYVFSDAEVVDQDLNPLGYGLWESYNFRGAMFEQFVKGEQLLSFMKGRFVTGATMGIRASLRDIVLPVPTDTVWVHDGWISIVTSSVGAYGVPVPDKLIFYRQHNLQQIGAKAPKPEDESVIGQFKAFRRDRSRIEHDLELLIPSLVYLREYLARMDGRNPDVMSAVNLIDQRVMHFKNRAAIQSAKGLTKLRLLCKEAASGRYGIFAESWKSILRDLFFD